MYQKSPFPYLIVLVAIIGLSCFTNLTIDKEIEQPITHEIHQSSTVETYENSNEFKLAKNQTQVAYNQ